MTYPIIEIQSAPAAPEGAPPRGGCGAPQAPASGLVNIKTSHTQLIEIDQQGARLARMRRNLLCCSEQHQLALALQGYKPAMLTLTYRDVDGYESGQISDLLNRVRNWLKRRRHDLHYVWVAELQKRGAVHYHVVIWLPRGLTLPKPDKQGWWPHGSTRIEWARRAVNYVLKYASKFDTKHQLPKGVRLHGAGGLDETGKKIRRWYNLPAWLKSLAGIESRFVRLKGGGLVDRDTGVCLSSPWRVSCCAGKVTATKIFDYVGGIDHVGGPYSMLGGGLAI